MFRAQVGAARIKQLNVIAKHLGIKLENHHRAYDDALATTQVFEKSLKNICKDKITNVEKLISFSKNSKTIASIKEIIQKQKED